MGMVDNLIGPISGVVASRKDPEGRGRVTVEVPNLFDGDDPERVSAWAEPLGLGGLGVDRGRFEVPEVGAEVAVFPVVDPITGRGNPDLLYYMTGPMGDGDVPIENPDGDPDVHLVVYRDYVIMVDEREGTSTISIRHRMSGDGFDHNATTLTTQVFGTARVVAESGSRLEAVAPILLLNGRLVLSGTGPI